VEDNFFWWVVVSNEFVCIFESLNQINMKTLNYFFEKAPLWQIFVLIWFLTGALITAPIFYGLQKIGATNPELDFSGMNCIKLGAGVGLLLGLISMFMVSMMRKSTIFWEYSKEVEALINGAATKKELVSIFENEFQDLRKKCQGGPQIPELNRLYTIMKTKIKYVPQ
jgi:hypothetical protein